MVEHHWRFKSIEMAKRQVEGYRNIIIQEEDKQ